MAEIGAKDQLKQYIDRIERLETEKINLERENKKMKTELMDSQVSGRSPMWNVANGSRNEEIRLLQQELIDKNKVKINLYKFV